MKPDIVAGLPFRHRQLLLAIDSLVCSLYVPRMEHTKGRGATSNHTSSRFGLPAHQQHGDWRDEQLIVDGKSMAVSTVVTEVYPKTILSFNQSPDLPFDRSINAYRGCEHVMSGSSEGHIALEADIAPILLWQ